MPSPFPGMDPYLEHPDIFPVLHDSMITCLMEFLQVRLPEPYYAGSGTRVWVETSERFIEPDVKVLRPTSKEGRRLRSGNGARSATLAVAEPPRTRPVRVTVPHDEHREAFLNIFVRRDRERLVGTIEVLSLTNKTPGAHGRDLYVRKQQEILRSQTHLIEIDLLRSGEHTTAVPLQRAVARTGPFDYHVCVHRFDNLEDYLVYPIRLEDRLPEIMVPLLPGDADVTIDLQAVFDRCYEIGPYRRQVRYDSDTPVPALDAKQRRWARQLLVGRGLRRAAKR